MASVYVQQLTSSDVQKRWTLLLEWISRQQATIFTCTVLLHLWIWMQTITGRHQLKSPSKFGYTYGRLKLVTISQSGVSPELFKVHASKPKKLCSGACAWDGSTTNNYADAICTLLFTLTSVIGENNLYQLWMWIHEWKYMNIYLLLKYNCMNTHIM